MNDICIPEYTILYSTLLYSAVLYYTLYHTILYSTQTRKPYNSHTQALNQPEKAPKRVSAHT